MNKTPTKKPTSPEALAEAAARKYLRGYTFDDARVLAKAMLEFAMEYAAGRVGKAKRKPAKASP